MSRQGIPLPDPGADGIMVCPENGYHYKAVEPGVIRCLDLDEGAPLPPDKAVGIVPYREFKQARKIL